MKAQSILLVAVISAVSVSCQQQSAVLTESERTEIQKQVRIQWEKKWEALNALDPEWLGLFSKREFLGYAHGGGTITSHEELVAQNKVWWGPRKEQSGELLQIRIHPLSADLALVDYTSNWQGADEDGRAWKYKCSNTLLYRREKEGWKMIYWHEQGQEIK